MWTKVRHWIIRKLGGEIVLKPTVRFDSEELKPVKIAFSCPAKKPHKDMSDEDFLKYCKEHFATMVVDRLVRDDAFVAQKRIAPLSGEDFYIFTAFLYQKQTIENFKKDVQEI